MEGEGVATLAERLWRAGIPREFTVCHGDWAGWTVRVVAMDDKGALIVERVRGNT